ncbi:type I-D CRISPR-associated protein Cas7/Csc2 [Rhodobacteraceae bacterium 2376]|uniref:Type I-D CRISPR-associated protein Cas7/Csc2 n=1 Tax=Rhabdonatronobacter sediminivivens TaxID=2743469 RepID=A0A7Z0L0S6_9RHOB|nr:type I-D CRISPR-associated protein Cas7/Csc2 [Rhabdonatronobacter sediminivivens]NYS26391.1 type I-D CRISPR-associated protein Cas7/Csc2 [Rhabdonatronobacter sediminivivens]
MTFHSIRPFMGDIDALISEATDTDGKTYAQPAFKNLGSVSIVLVREVISPASFRNADAEITDIEVAGRRHVRAVANKFKFGERARGLQVLRHFNAGGVSPQNRTAFHKNERPSAKFDLNAFVFGDSANHGSRVLPVKAAAQYSDAVSVQDYGDAVDLTFHNRASEDGSLFDAQGKKNSTNIFERHFIKPGTLLIQTISFNGRTAPIEALEHLLLSVGLAGAYGGATSIYGINVRNHIVGIYGGRFERDLVSPYVALQTLRGQLIDGSDATAVVEALAAAHRAAWSVEVQGREVHAAQVALIDRLEGGDEVMAAGYTETAAKLRSYFDLWFDGVS